MWAACTTYYLVDVWARQVPFAGLQCGTASAPCSDVSSGWHAALFFLRPKPAWQWQSPASLQTAMRQPACRLLRCRPTTRISQMLTTYIRACC